MIVHIIVISLLEFYSTQQLTTDNSYFQCRILILNLFLQRISLLLLSIMTKVTAAEIYNILNTKQSLQLFLENKIKWHFIGVPPTDAQSFVNDLVSSSLDLHHLMYSVLALGDTNYVHFCEAGRSVDQRWVITEDLSLVGGG